MEELTLGGKKYISSKRAAEISGYTKDYIGQLARAGSLQAKMVGRSWYIEVDAIEAHKKMYQGKPVIEHTTHPQSEEKTSISNSFSKNNNSKTPTSQHLGPKQLSEIFEVKYESDTRPLMPQLSQVEKKEDESKIDTQDYLSEEEKIPDGGGSARRHIESNTETARNTIFATKIKQQIQSGPTVRIQGGRTRRHRKKHTVWKTPIVAGLALPIIILVCSIAFVELAQTYVRTEEGYRVASEQYYLGYMSAVVEVFRKE